MAGGLGSAQHLAIGGRRIMTLSLSSRQLTLCCNAAVL
jgi:hypothetical protein